MTAAPLPTDAPLPPELRFLAGGGEATKLILARDWSDHLLGQPSDWPEALKVTLSAVLNSPESMILAWGEEDLTFFFNETYFPMLGPRLDWAMGAPFTEVWADAWAQARPIIEAAFRGEDQRFVDLPWKLDTDRGPADTWWTFSYSRILDAAGGIAALLIFTNETTSRVLADAALADSQAALRTLNATLEEKVTERTAERDRIWRSTNDLMGTAGLDGYLKSVNPAWTAALGWSEQELLAKPFVEIIAAADHAETAAVVARLAAGETVTNFTDHLHTRDGGSRTIMWDAVPVPGTQEFGIIGRDLTEQALAEDALRQSQKMEAVGQLTGGLAHDFNNLLAGISGSLELMSMRLAQGRIADVEKYLAAAQGATRRAAALTHRLLAFSRRQTLAPEATDVDRLVAGMAELIRRTTGPSIELEVVGTAGLWTALVDPPQLENALLNLCINARDAMPDGGRITIETANKWLDRSAAAAHDMPEGQYLSLCVTDTGSGMAPDVIERAFDPFFTTKPIGEGTGLGLSMIYGFAKQSGGQVRIYSEVGEGTTVCIYLPRHFGEAEAVDVAPVAALERSTGGRTVLVVDDEPTVRMLVAEVLDGLGYSAIEAADSVSGLKVLHSDVTIDLLVTDIGLPGGMNGRQLAAAARVRRPALKVLFITGYAENALIGDGRLLPGMAVLTKPFPLETVGRRIREMIEG